MSNKPTSDAFFTRAKANQGIDLPLTLPDGTKTDHVIRIRGVDSDAFRRAEDEAQRAFLEGMASTTKGDTTKVAELMQERRLATLASLVISWTFEDRPCELANVVEFLREAPQIADAIDRQAARRALFFRSGSASSSPSPAQSSS